MNIDFFSARSLSLFKPFSAIHIIALMLIVVLSIFLLYILRNKTDRDKKAFRVILGCFALFLQIFYDIWLIVNGNFNLKESLPLNICSVSLILVFILFLTRNKIIFSIQYFWGIIGSSYALIFPNIMHNFPHFRFVEYFLAHGLILFSVLYFLFIEKYTITIKSSVTTYVFSVLYLGIVFLLNLALGANYLFLIRKPQFSSFLDIFGNYYRLGLLLGILILFIILYIPFILPKLYMRNRK